MGPTTSNSTSHDQVETPGLHDAKQVETPSIRSAEPSGEDDQVETPDPHKTTPTGESNQVKTPNKEIEEVILKLK